MKKLEIKTEKATLLVVDLPTCKTHLFYKGLNEKCRKISQGDTQGFYYIGTDCKYLGKVSEITEEEWAEIVDTGVDFVKETTHFIDYVDESSLYRTAAMSGLSLLKANGVLLENKSTPLLSYSWMELQQELWSNPHVFIKVD